MKVSQVTAVINPGDQFQIKIVLYPSIGEFYLTAKGLSGKTLNVEVVNSLGQNMLQWKQKVTGNNFNKLIDLRSASDGAYYLKITVDKKIYLRKLIKIG